MSISTAVFDLETSALTADEGIILCGVVQSSRRTKPYVLRIDQLDSKTWRAGKRGHDRNTVRALVELLSDHDVLVAHNGSFFDLPMLRTRQLRWGDKPMPDMKVIDPWKVAKRKFNLKSNSLARVADFVGIRDRKTPLNMSTWAAAMQDGDKAALDLIVEHCIADVRVLDGVLGFVKPFIKVLDSQGSAL